MLCYWDFCHQYNVDFKQQNLVDGAESGVHIKVSIMVEFDYILGEMLDCLHNLGFHQHNRSCKPKLL